MREAGKSILRLLIAAVSLMGAGCAAAPVALLPIAAPAVLAGASGGISYTFTNIAIKTTNYPMEQVAEASLKALGKMGIKVVGKEKSPQRVEIKAATSRLTIYITARYMTPVLTRLEVNAKKGLLLKDKGTAFEIVLLTERYLLDVEHEGPQLAEVLGAEHPLSTDYS